MRRSLLTAAAFLSLLTSSPVACVRSRGVTLTLAGSTSVQPVAESWAEAYRALHPELAIQVQGGGSTAGIQAAMSGAAQIGLSSRPLTADERVRLEGVLVARDGIAIVVHPTNPVADLHLGDVRAVYAGQVRTWSRFAGRDQPITLVTREEGSGTRSAFETLVMGARPIAPFALVQDSTGAVRQMVASDAAAIGYLSFGLVDASVKAVRLDGVEARESNVDAGTYPLVRPFFFAISPRDRATPLVSDFVRWVLGPEGRSLASGEGLLPPPS
ncbi:MAG TPA: phosphate ABC transporter substrate-binding protein [Polyangia bacterium]